MFGGGTRIAKLALAIVLASQAPAFAGDRITELTTMLSSSSEKTRLSAVLSLARLGDKRALKPLVNALHDPSAGVRAIAATALGKLGHKAALPALKTAAHDDVDDTVRAKAAEAVASVSKANGIADEAPMQARTTKAKTSGFGRAPHAVENQPDLYVLVKGANDDSPGNKDKAQRKANAEILKAVLQDSLRTAPLVTSIANDAERWGLDMRNIDVSVTKLDVVQSGGYVEIQAELRLAISDNQGKMLSFLSGGAKVQVPQKKYNAKYLPSLRKEALEGAMRGMFDKLIVHLRQITTT